MADNNNDSFFVDLTTEPSDEASGPICWGFGPVPTLQDLDPQEQRLFQSLQQVKDAVKYLGVKHSFPYTVKQSCSQRYEVGCDEGKEDNIRCSFHIKARLQQRFGGKYTIIKSNLEHSCGCMFSSKRHARGLGAKFVSAQAGPFITDCGKATPREVARKRRESTTF